MEVAKSLRFDRIPSSRVCKTWRATARPSFATSVLRVWSEEQNAWIRATRTCVPETRRNGSSATEISEGHALRMPSSAREVVLPPADATAMLAVGWIKAAKLVDDEH
jgi:hypothetical protein